MSWISLAVGTATAVGGAVAKGKANKKAAELKQNRPKYKKSEKAQQEVSLAESELSQGMSARAERAYKEQSDKQFTASLGAILKGGGSVNNVADIYNGSEEGRARLAIMEDSLRLNQISNVVGAWRNFAGEENKEFEFNQWMPWADDAQANAVAKQQAQQSVSQGIGMIGSGAASLGKSISDKAAYDRFFRADSRDSGTGSNFVQQQTQATPVNVNSMDVVDRKEPPAKKLSFGNSNGNYGFEPIDSKLFSTF